MTRRLKNHELEPVKHNISKFTWIKGERKFVAEVSTLGPRWMDRLYNDACDVGFAIVNPKTGNEVIFSGGDRVERDGEIILWHFDAKDPRFGVMHATIFND